MRKFSLVSIFFSIVFLVSVNTAQAASFKNGDRVSIPKNQTISESLYVSGQSIDIQGNVDGDIFCGGQTVRISGNVNGDVICGAQTLTITGRVNGNIRAGAQTISLEGQVDRNVNLFGQHVEISSSSAVLGEANIWSQDADIRGSITKKLFGGAQNVTINGTVGGDVNLQVENLNINPEAQIQRNLTYTSANKVNIPNTNIVGGKITQHQPATTPKERQEQRKAFAKGAWGIGRIISLLAQIVLAVLLIAFFSKPMLLASEVMYKKMFPAFGIGLLVLILVPLVIVIFAITIIGIPLSILLLFAYIFSFFIGRVLAANVVGRLLLERFWVDKKEDNYWSVIIGIIALWFIFSIPIIGTILSLLTLVWGLGGVYYLFRPSSAKAMEKK